MAERIFEWSGDKKYYVVDTPKGKVSLVIQSEDYIVPLQINVHMMDSPDVPEMSPYIPGLTPDTLCVGHDIISNSLYYWGGGVDLREGLWSAGIREGGEECGANRRIRNVSKRVITFASLNNKEDPTKDDIPTLEPEVGEVYKSRNVFRVVSQRPPIQQPPDEGHPWPEFLRPRYEPIVQIYDDNRVIRQSFRFALKQAEMHRMLFLETDKLPAIAPDLHQLGEEWTRMKFHPALVDFYCDGYGQKRSRRNEYIEKYGDILAVTFLNMEYMSAGLDRLLRHFHAAEDEAYIREIVEQGKREGALIRQKQALLESL